MTYSEDYGILNFYTLLQQAGLSRDMQLRVTAFIVNGIEQLNPSSLIFVKGATVPGKTIAVQNVGFMGTQLQIPGGVSFTNPWNVTFYCTQDYNVRKLLEKSMLNTFDPGTSMANIEPRELNTHKIELTLLNDSMYPLRKYSLLGAFVSDMAPIDYDATGNGQIKQLAASISYQYWTAEDEEEYFASTDDTALTRLRNNNPLQNILPFQPRNVTNLLPRLRDPNSIIPQVRNLITTNKKLNLKKLLGF